jgi:hypothetical protein
LIDGTLSAGIHRVTWKSQMTSGMSAGSGIYYYRLSSADGTLTQKMILLK